MLSIGAMSSGQAEYYLSLAKEDYYLEGGEPKGIWLGKGATALGLSGEVEPESLRLLFAGFGNDNNKLVQNAGKKNRQPGWDLTFSAPKSVSVLWSQVDSTTQVAIQLAHAVAVKKTIAYLEENYAQSRVGQGGSDRVASKLVVAMFEHSCSRALDPQLHTHALVMNLGVDEKGITRSILSKPFYQAKMLSGAYYRCELANQLQARIGVVTYRPLDRKGEPKSWFEIRGVAKEVADRFSKRRTAILKELGSRGLESASAAAFATLSTRKAKELVPPRSELHARWKEEGKEYGFSMPAMKRTERNTHQPHGIFKQSLAEAIDRITFSENFFTPDELIRRTLEAAQASGIEAASIADAVKSELLESDFFVSLGVRDGKELWTTSEVLEVEQEFLQAASDLRERVFEGVSDKILTKVLGKLRGEKGEQFLLDAEQQEAVRYITQGTESLKVVTGFAGTGKTDMLAAAREALEAGGYKVIGAALAGVAARGLEEKTGIESQTVRMREIQLYPSLKHRLAHHATQLVRAALGKKTDKIRPLVIDKKTVLIIDEAGMVGTRDFALLVRAVKEQGGSVVAVGDEWQLPSIERGGCLGSLAKSINGVHLSEIRRQQDFGDREAVRNLVGGSPEEVLKHYAQKGQFFVAENHDATEKQLVADWARAGGVSEPAKHRIFASTHLEVDRYNERCQNERIVAGKVDATKSVEHNDRRFVVGDEVVFKQADRKRGVKKEDSGTVIACKEGVTGKYVVVRKGGQGGEVAKRSSETVLHHAEQLVRVALGQRTEKLSPRKDLVLVPLKTLSPLESNYKGLRLAYCDTVHASQGQTVQCAYVHLGGKMADRELSYVQGSRHKEKLMLYASEKEAGAALAMLAQTRHSSSEQDDSSNYSSLLAQMKHSRAKILAHEVSPNEHQIIR